MRSICPHQLRLFLQVKILGGSVNDSQTGKKKKISDVLNTDLRPWKRKLIGRLSTQFTWSSSYQCVGSEQTTTELTSSTRLVIGEGGTVSAP